MTTRIDNDGPAYPFEIENKSTEDIPDIFGGVVRAGTTRVYAGLTLRDAFAISVAGDIWSAYQSDGTAREYDDWRDGVAVEAYRLADSMLRARSQGEPDAT